MVPYSVTIANPLIIGAEIAAAVSLSGAYDVVVAFRLLGTQLFAMNRVELSFAIVAVIGFAMLGGSIGLALMQLAEDG